MYSMYTISGQLGRGVIYSNTKGSVNSTLGPLTCFMHVLTLPHWRFEAGDTDIAVWEFKKSDMDVLGANIFVFYLKMGPLDCFF